MLKKKWHFKPNTLKIVEFIVLNIHVTKSKQSIKEAFK